MKWPRWFTRKPVLPTALKTGDIEVLSIGDRTYYRQFVSGATKDPDSWVTIPIDRATEYVPELGNIRSCVRPEEYVYDWQKDGL